MTVTSPARLTVEFAAREELRTEISAKFTPERLTADLSAARLEPVELFTDPDGCSASRPGALLARPTAAGQPEASRDWGNGRPRSGMLDPRRLGAARGHARGYRGRAQALATASAVSQSIAAMERYLDLQLLERTSRVTLTPAGMRLVEHADVILAHLDAAEREAALRSTRGDLAHPGHVRQRRRSRGAGRERARTVAAEHRAARRRGRPGLQRARAAQRERRRRADLRQRRPAPEPPTGWRSRRCCAEPVLAIVPADHPLAGREAVRLVELAGERFIAEPAADHRPFTLVPAMRGLRARGGRLQQRLRAHGGARRARRCGRADPRMAVRETDRRRPAAGRARAHPACGRTPGRHGACIPGRVGDAGSAARVPGVAGARGVRAAAVTPST